MTQNAILPDWMLAADTEADKPVELTSEEADSFALFVALDTQWRFHPMAGIRLGLDYMAIEPTARMLGIEMLPQRLLDIRAMEAAALAEFSRASR
jgi:hypothetical protein